MRVGFWVGVEVLRAGVRQPVLGVEVAILMCLHDVG
jgi:hypothetical protein